MTMPTDLRTVKTFPQLLRYLRDELLWPIESDDAEELSFEYAPADFAALAPEHHVQIDKILQLRPLVTGQPWGIFYVQFKKARLPVVVLRELLASLVFKKRASANKSERPAWECHDLLFISSYGDDGDQRHLNFAHFSDSPNGSHLPALRVLDWDEDDTDRALQRLDGTLHERLRWPEDDTNLEKWREQWSAAFQRGLRYPIRKAEQLANALAALAQNIRGSVLAQMAVESERGKLRTLHAAFKATLIQDLEPKQFADMFAQTVAYGLFTNATRRTVAGAGTAITADGAVESITSLSPFLRDLLNEFLSVGGRRRSGIDYDKLGVNEVVDLLNADSTDLKAVLDDFGHKKRDDDPVIHFYETFLAVYDKDEKVRRGVFYTPQPVVSYIVRGVHELLQSDFGLTHGLASTETWGEILKKQTSLKLPPLTDEHGETRMIAPSEFFVQVLDPATGTATFLVETIGVIYGHLKTVWETKGGLAAMPEIHAKPSGTPAPKSFSDYWNIYVPTSLLPRLYGYELMMAPYAIAHMKIALKLADTGFSAWARLEESDRVRIYLTNALEPAAKQLALIGFDALSHEAAAVNEIKRHKRFTIVVGNPPYSDASQNMGEWTAPLIEPFRFYQLQKIKERGAIRFEHCINNDYVKFWGLTLAVVAQTPFAVVSMITSNTFLGGKSFRGVRDAMLGRVSRIEVLDLHGEGWAGQLAKQGVKDENVFEITTGVSITSLIKPLRNTSQAAVVYAELTGSYEEKSSVLLDPRNRIKKTPVVLDPHHYCPFALQGESDSDEYWSYPQVDTLFRASVDGIKTSRDGLVIANTREKCSEKIQAFARCTAAIEEVERIFSVSAKGFEICRAQRHLSRNFDEGLIYPILYRPFDIRYIYYDKELILSHRMNVMPSMFHRQAWSLVFASRLSSKGFDHVIACSTLCAHKCASHDINSRMFPVVGLFQALMGKESLMSNLADVSAKMLPSPKGEPEIRHASWFGEYVYAVVNAPSYRSRYYECISQDFPRIPMTTNPELALRLSEHGKLLVELHTLNALPPDGVFPFSGSANDELVSPSWKNGVLTVGRSSEISGVDREIWEFRMCGYDVCKSWFSAGWKAGIQREGEPLTGLYATQLRTLLWSVRETLRIRREIDDLIDDSGGWPGAFSGPVFADNPAPASETVIGSPPPAPQELGIPTEDELPLG